MHPTSLGSYDIVRALGEGAAGDVYLAKDRTTGREVALKVLRRTAPRELARFLEEADAVRRLEHPNIVEVYALEEIESSFCLSMRYVPGGSLATATTMTVRDALIAMRDVCLATQYAHTAGILHLDLKPSNILLDPERGPQIVDFGLARRVLSVTSETITRTGSVAGTPGFLAPEQAQGATDRFSFATDVFAIGATLYYLLTGRIAFEAPSAAQSMTMTLQGDFPPPSRINHAIPREVEAIVLKAMNNDPRRRFSSAEAMACEIGRYLDGERVHAVYDVFANAVDQAQDQGLRVRRKILFAFAAEKLTAHWTSEETGLYEATTISDVAAAKAHIVSSAVDALVVSDEMPLATSKDLLATIEREQPEACRIYVHSEKANGDVLEELVNECGIAAVVNLGRSHDGLGQTLSRVLSAARADASPLALRDQVNDLRRQLRSVQESLFVKNRDLEAKSIYLQEKVTELTRMRTALLNLSTELRQKNIEVENAKKKIEDLSVTDELTGAMNRRGFFEAGKLAVKRQARSGNAMSALMLDIDFFKKVNDTHGHAVGDLVLRAVAKLLRTTFRETDVVGRLGGEEFCALLPEADPDGALVVGERVRAEIEAARFELPTGGTLSVTISIGCASIVMGDLASHAVDPLKELLKAADDALYRAKAKGRNRVERGATTSMPPPIGRTSSRSEG